MAKDDLAPQQRAALLLLLGVATQVGNNELKERYGITLTGKDKTRLNELKLVESTKGLRGQLFHELTDQGWAQARNELTGDLPPSSKWTRAVAVSTAEQLDRYLRRADLRLHEVFQPAEAEMAAPAADADAAAPAATSGVTAPTGESAAEPAALADRIRSAYWRVTRKPNGWVLLSALREQLSDVPRTDLDAALVALNAAPDVTFSTENNKRSLADGGAAAVVLGNQKQHLIAIEGA